MIYFIENGKKVGPFTPDQIRRFAETGRIRPDLILEDERGRKMSAELLSGIKFPAKNDIVDSVYSENFPNPLGGRFRLLGKKSVKFLCCCLKISLKAVRRILPSKKVIKDSAGLLVIVCCMALFTGILSYMMSLSFRPDSITPHEVVNNIPTQVPPAPPAEVADPPKTENTKSAEADNPESTPEPTDEDKLAAQKIAELKIRANQLLEELLDFKDDPEFHDCGFGLGGPYTQWDERVKKLRDDKDMLDKKYTGVLGPYFSFAVAVNYFLEMGHEFCRSKGKPTDYTNRFLPEIRDAFNTDEKKGDVRETQAAPPENTDDSSDKNNTPSYSSRRKGENIHGAWAYATLFVERELLAPGSAKYKFAAASSGAVTPIDENTYKVSSYVDAQNMFGAKIRSDFSLTIREDKVRDKWILIDGIEFSNSSILK